MSAKNGKADRIDVAFIRKSSAVQDETAQIRNVENMLREIGVHVPDRNWFTCTVPRANVQGNVEFKRLLALIEADKVGTVYIESQDRFGTGDVSELFTLLGVLSAHGTRLYDLRDKSDLTGKDDATEMRVFLGGFKSKKERADIASRSLRTKVCQCKDRGSWPSGIHPFGFGKRCLAPDGRVLWEWQPTTRCRGRLFYPKDKALVLAAEDVRVPRREKVNGQLPVTVLVPSDDTDRVRAVKLIYDLYTRVGLSRRQISVRLNAEGLLLTHRPFTHTAVTQILENPAYCGDTEFGKVRAGRHYTFNADGILARAKANGVRDKDQRLIRRDTHEGLVDRRTWELAQRKLAKERERAVRSPRTADHYLKTLLVCGHCGKGMIGRTETRPDTGERVPVYICSSYVKGMADGHGTKCGYQRITHADAERLLLDKIKQDGLAVTGAASASARDNLRARLDRLGAADEESMKQWERWFEEGIDALAEYLREQYPEAADYPEVKKLRKLSFYFYTGDLDGDPAKRRPFGGLPINVGEVRQAVREAEAVVVAEARRKVAQLTAEHKTLTLQWAKASASMQEVLKEEIERIDERRREWEAKAVPLSERMNGLAAAEAERQAERERLEEELPKMENREKGEAFKRLFDTVTLWWKKKWHPAPAKPARKPKTNRKGRWSYTLQEDRIEWKSAASESFSTDTTCSPGTCSRSGR
jgi:hypothetical protein